MSRESRDSVTQHTRWRGHGRRQPDAFFLVRSPAPLREESVDTSA
jgi:hypothetical protein